MGAWLLVPNAVKSVGAHEVVSLLLRQEGPESSAPLCKWSSAHRGFSELAHSHPLPWVCVSRDYGLSQKLS